MVIKALKNKKYYCLLVAVVVMVIFPSFYLHVCFAQSTDNSSNVGNNDSSVSAADADWVQAAGADSSAVQSDIDGLMKDPNAIIYPDTLDVNETCKIYSVALMTDSQKALYHSKDSIVSSELEPTKTAYENAMKQAYYAGFYAHKAVTEATAGGNKTEAVNDLQSTYKYITSYNTYINDANRWYMIYLQPRVNS